MHSKLPVEDEQVFDLLLDLTQLLYKYDIDVEKINISKGLEIKLYLGNVRVELGTDENLSEENIIDVRRKIGMVFQQFNLFNNKTVLENVAEGLIYGHGVEKAKAIGIARQAIDKVGLSDHYDYYPSQLSGGQQQRVAIARAVVTRPRLILADEPTGNLDSTNGREVMALLRQLNEGGTTVVMVTHSMRDASYATRTINLFDGEVVDKLESL